MKGNRATYSLEDFEADGGPISSDEDERGTAGGAVVQAGRTSCCGLTAYQGFVLFASWLGTRSFLHKTSQICSFFHFLMLPTFRHYCFFFSRAGWGFDVFDGTLLLFVFLDFSDYLILQFK
jgi:hypothetical protein